MKLSIFLILALAVFKSHKVFSASLDAKNDNVRIVEAAEKKDIFEINKGMSWLIDGDVVPKKSKDTRNTARDETTHWPSTVIPFKYSQIVSLEAIGSIELARQEYRLRTCLDLVEADNDTENFISFQTRSGNVADEPLNKLANARSPHDWMLNFLLWGGTRDRRTIEQYDSMATLRCWSSVGMVGGGQAISIGNGCERMAVVCHEIMHAIGIWHEQSRADRDDYVEIVWDLITDGYENNFNKYDWDRTDARRVAYDYNSIMHYGDTGFSITGEPTIRTRDPAFQDIIGQRLTFSRGDSDKINRMYKCSDTLLVSYNCNYDDETACGYMQDYDTDQVDWKRYKVGDKSISISTVAPTLDATLGVSGKGSYMFLDTSGKTSGDTAEMRSMRSVSKSDVQCLTFSYYLDRTDSSDATISAYIANVDSVTGGITTYGDPIATFAENTGKKWQIHRMTLRAPPAYRIVFRGKTGGSDEDVVALDDVSVQDKPCEDSYFVQDDYSNILETSVKGDFFTSPILTSNLGYRFRIRVYPQGAGSSTSGYMGVRIGLVKGLDDENLAWPFCNKYIRLMIVDKNDNPLYALNKYAEFVTTEEAGGDLWNKPDDPNEPVGYYGYSNFMPISDLVNTHNYLKHDSLMMSVLIKDMNWVNGDECTEPFTKSATRYTDKGYGIDFVDGEFGDRDDDDDDDDDHHNGHNHGDHDHGHDLDHYHEHNHDHEHDHDHDYHHEHNHDHDHDHDDHHDDDDHDQEAKIPVGTAVGIALGCAGFVLVVMTGVLCCVQKSHKQSMKHVANNISLQPRIEVLPAYEEGGRVKFETLPEKV